METVSLNHPLHLEEIDPDITHQSVDVIANTAISEAQQSASDAVSRQIQVDAFRLLIGKNFVGTVDQEKRNEYNEVSATIRVPWNSPVEIDPLIAEALLTAKIPKKIVYTKE